MTTEDRDLLVIAEEAVDAAVEWLGQAESGWSRRRFKASGEEVTDADIEVERRVTRMLLDRAPGTPVVGEESVSVDGPASAPRYWLLDPIDGTMNFARGGPFHAISLALVSEGDPVLGVIHAPALGRRWSAGPGVVSAGAPLWARTVSEAVVGVSGTGSVMPAMATAFVGLLHDTAYRLRMHGAMSLDLVGVAEGWLDACVCLGPKPWDVAAGIALVRARGGAVLGQGGGLFSWDSRILVAGDERFARELVGLWEAMTPADS